MIFIDLKKERSSSQRALIQKNMAALLQTDQEMLVPMPLIPDVNNDRSNLAAVGRILQFHRQGLPLEILPYHRLGRAKYERLDRSWDMEKRTPCLPPDRTKAWPSPSRCRRTG